jgi:hypothetical protein
MIEVFKQMVEALENSVDLVIEDAYHAEQIYANIPTRQARVGGLKLLAEEHQKAIKAGKKLIAELESQEQWGASAMMNPDYIAEQQKKTKQIRAMLESQELAADDFFKMIADSNPKPFPLPQRTRVVFPTMLSQCPQCGLSKSSGAMGSVLPQCQCNWKMPTPQRTWVGLTDEEKKNIFLKWYGKQWGYTSSIKSVMNSVEAKLKEKNSA